MSQICRKYNLQHTKQFKIEYTTAFLECKMHVNSTIRNEYQIYPSQTAVFLSYTTVQHNSGQTGTPTYISYLSGQMVENNLSSKDNLAWFLELDLP